MRTPNNDEQLLAYAEGSLAGAAAKEIESRLAVDAEAARVVEHYRMVARAVATDDSTAPSSTAVHRAKAIFATSPKPQLESWLAAIDRFVACCIFDSRVELAGVRSAALASPILLSFASESHEVDLQIDKVEQMPASYGTVGEMAPTDWVVIGQLSCLKPGESAAHRRVAMSAAGSYLPLVHTTTDEHGGFSLRLGSGRYDLHIHCTEGVMVLPQINMT